MALGVLPRCCIVVLLTQYPTALLKSSNAPVVPAEILFDSVNKLSRENIFQGTMLDPAPQFRFIHPSM